MQSFRTGRGLGSKTKFRDEMRGDLEGCGRKPLGTPVLGLQVDLGKFTYSRSVDNPQRSTSCRYSCSSALTN